MKNGTITLKGKDIVQIDITMKDWGFSFFVTDELDAYKAAYVYRNSPNGLIVEPCPNGMWMVTVFNKVGAESGLQGSHK